MNSSGDPRHPKIHRRMSPRSAKFHPAGPLSLRILLQPLAFLLRDLALTSSFDSLPG
jgi:hypothetical protein